MDWSSNPTQIALGFGIGLAVGALVGVERERRTQAEETPSFAGVRTFPMLALFGGLAGLTSRAWGPLSLLPPFIVVGVLVAMSYWWKRKRQQAFDPGLTTEIVALAVFVLGALPFLAGLGLEFYERLMLTGGLGVVMTAFLSLKGPLHRVVEKVDPEDIYATIRFLLLSVVLLPLLPNEPYGPYGALNPFWTGVVVVMIAGIGFVGYFAVKFLGPRRGVGFTAMAGGLASSTAVTLEFSARGKQAPRLALLCAFAIVLSSTVMYPRILIELSAIDPSLVRRSLLPIGGMFAVGVLGSAVIFWRVAREAKTEGEPPKFANPFSVVQAVKLGLLFAAVRFAVAAAHAYFGDAGLYVSTAIAGLTDVDAITVSIAQMHGADSLATHTATFAVVLAAASNTATKAGIAVFLGGWRVGRAVLAVLVPSAILGLFLALL